MVLIDKTNADIEAEQACASWSSATMLTGATLLALAACTSLAPEDAKITADEHIPTVAHVRFTTRRPADSFVRFHTVHGEEAPRRTPPLRASIVHEHDLIGLKAGRCYTVELVTEGADTTGQAMEHCTPAPPRGVDRLAISDYDVSRAEPGGWILTSVFGLGASYAVIYDRMGDPVWCFPADEGQLITTARLSLDGRSVIFIQGDRDQAEDKGGIVRVALDGSQIATTYRLRAHNDFAELPEGGEAWLSFELGHFPVGEETVYAAVDSIRERAAGASEDRVVFDFSRDYPELVQHCGHLGGDAYHTGAADWTHANSLVPHPNKPAWLLMSRKLSSILAIDRAAGQVLWTLGGPGDDFTWEEPDAAWQEGHFSQAWEGGLLVFDNGTPREPQRSRVVEYALDEEARTVRQVWEHWHPEGVHVGMLGDAKRLPSGNTLISWTTRGLLEELSPEGEVVWRAETELSAATGRLSWMEALYP